MKHIQVAISIEKKVLVVLTASMFVADTINQFQFRFLISAEPKYFKTHANQPYLL